MVRRMKRLDTRPVAQELDRGTPLVVGGSRRLEESREHNNKI